MASSDVEAQVSRGWLTRKERRYEVPPNLCKTPAEYETLRTEMREIQAVDPRTWAFRARELCRIDLCYLISEVLSTRVWWHPEMKRVKLFQHPWMMERCRDAQFGPSEYLRVLPRGHGKSTIYTFGKIIHLLLQDPNATIGIFSVTKEIAQKFGKMLMFELEQNELLRQLFPDVLWRYPKKEAPQWSLVDGFTIRRSMNFKDASVTCFGLRDGNFTGVRLKYGFYDDVVNETTVTTPEQVDKVNERWELSLNLGMPGARNWYVGTFYSSGDTYHHLVDRGVGLDFHSCYEVDQKRSRFSRGGIPEKLGLDYEKPVLFSRDYLKRKAEEMGPKTFGIQMEGCPTGYAVTEFRDEWFRTYETAPEVVGKKTNNYLLVDPAGKRGSNKHSFTAMLVFGVGVDRNLYLLDGLVDRLNLAERGDAVFEFVQKWNLHEVRYEDLGFQADIEHLEYRMDRESFFFEITAVKGNVQKEKRVERLIPLFREGRIKFPIEGIPYVQRETNTLIDFVDHWVRKELLPFPNVVHMDISDAAARIAEPDLPIDYPRSRAHKDAYRRGMYASEPKKKVGGWMSA